MGETFEEKIKSHDLNKKSEPPSDNSTNQSLDKMIKASQMREKVDSKLKGIVMITVKTLPLVMINIIALFIIGLDNFIEGKWSWAIFSQPSFWYSYLSFQTANWLVAINFLTSSIKKIKSSEKAYINNLNAIQKNVDADHDKPFITKQAEIETLMRKKEMLEMYVYEKMHRLSVKHGIKSVDKFLRENDSDVLKGKEKRLYLALDALKRMLTDEWQRDYLKSYKIKYPAVTRSILTSGFSARNKNGQYNTYRTNVVSTTTKMVAPNTLTASLLAFVLLSFQFVPKEASVATALKFVIQLFLITWNTITTLTLVYTIFSLTYLRSSEERSSDLERLQKRDENNNVGVPQLILDIVDKPKAVENVEVEGE
jgi:hypothetical protein